MQKTILYLWQQPFPWDVRAEKVCATLADADHRVVMLARWKGEALERENYRNFEIVRVGFRQPSYFSLPTSLNPVWRKAIARAVDEFMPDIIMPREIMFAEAAEAAARRHRIPVIIDMAEHYPAAMRSWKKYAGNFLLRFIVHTLRYPDIVERRSVLGADGIITVCEEQNVRLTREYGFSGDRMEVVYNSPEPDWFTAVKKGAADPPLTFAHHGYMTPERGLDMLIRAFGIAEREIPGIRLVLAGDGESMPDLRAIAETLPSRDKIIFTGKYSHDELIRMYSETDIAVIPNRSDEFRNHTIPNKIFDYMACGKPLIVSKAHPLERMMRETQSGISVDCSRPEPLAEAMIGMYHSNTASFSSNGRKAFAERYNWSEDAKRLLNFIKKFF